MSSGNTRNTDQLDSAVLRCKINKVQQPLLSQYGNFCIWTANTIKNAEFIIKRHNRLQLGTTIAIQVVLLLPLSTIHIYSKDVEISQKQNNWWQCPHGCGHIQSVEYMVDMSVLYNGAVMGHIH